LGSSAAVCRPHAGTLPPTRAPPLPAARAAPAKGQRAMQHSASLQLTVDQVLERAQRVLASAK
jgi:hypothetical protein